jgi:hypothetical protein
MSGGGYSALDDPKASGSVPVCNRRFCQSPSRPLAAAHSRPHYLSLATPRRRPRGQIRRPSGSPTPTSRPSRRPRPGARSLAPTAHPPTPTVRSRSLRSRALHVSLRIRLTDLATVAFFFFFCFFFFFRIIFFLEGEGGGGGDGGGRGGIGKTHRKTLSKWMYIFCCFFL